MQLNNALFNWLQIEIVREARPSDRSAKETAVFFEELLQEDHQVVSIKKRLVSNNYEVVYQSQDDDPQVKIFPRDVAEKLLNDILSEPKYNQSYDED